MAARIAATRSPLLWAALPLVAMSWALGVGRRGRLCAGAQIQRLVWRTDGSWPLFESGDEWARARLLGHSVIQPSLKVLNFRRMGDGARRTVVLGGTASRRRRCAGFVAA